VEEDERVAEDTRAGWQLTALPHDSEVSNNNANTAADSWKPSSTTSPSSASSLSLPLSLF
jgi:hypothetical protein